MNKVGGMDIHVFDSINGEIQDTCLEIKKLGHNPYHYELLQMGAKSKYVNTKSMRCCVFISESEVDGVSINGNNLYKDEYLLGDIMTLNISAISSATILLAYFPKNVLFQNYSIFHQKNAKKVMKPWGYEVWLTGDPSELFALKQIFIKSGNKTSLQYHKFKRETNFIIEGVASLSYDKKGIYSEGEAFSISVSRFKGPFVVDVFPNTIHRLEALTDLVLLEISTPELDDVIRLQDDSGRTNGRVTSEHVL